MVRLIVTDVDRTLIRDGGFALDPRYYEVIRELRKRGVLFAVASGRQYASIERLFDAVKNDILYIAENGALIRYQGMELFCEAMKKEDIREIISDTRKMDGCQCLYDARDVSCYEKGDTEVYRLMKDHYQYNCRLVDDLTRVEEPCLKYSVYRTSQVEEVAGETFIPKWSGRLTVACGGSRFIDVMSRNVNKGAALRRVQELLGIGKEETAAVGDNINDLEMLEQAWYSYAIGNARPEVKQAARFTADTNINGGVLKILESLLREGDGNYV